MLAPDVGTYNATNVDELQSVVLTDSAALELARAGRQEGPTGTSITIHIQRRTLLGSRP